MSNQDNMWQKLMKQSSGKKTSNLLNAQAQTQAVKATMPQLHVAKTTQVPQVSQVAQVQNLPQATQQSAQTAQTTAQSVAQANQQAYNELLRQSQSAPQSQNDRFIQWWNENAGVGDFDKDKGYYRTDAMDDTTYRVGQNMYDGYLQKQDLLTEYQTQQERLNREKYQQEANANYQKWLMQKYLPDMMNKNGYSGNLGLVRDANLGIDNDYLKSLSNINTNYNDTMNDLTSDYNTNLRTINENVSSKNDVLYDKQDAKKEQSQNDWYENMQNTLADMFASEKYTNEDVLEYLNKYQNKLSNEQYEMLKGNIEYQQKKKDIQSLDDFKAGKSAIETQDGYRVALTKDSKGMTGSEFNSQLQFLKSIEDTDFQKRFFGYSYSDIEAQLQKMGYTDVFDKNITNGTTIRITRKSKKKTITSYMTYVDGVWYTTQRV